MRLRTSLGSWCWVRAAIVHAATIRRKTTPGLRSVHLVVHDVRTAAQSIDGGLIFAGLTLVSLLFSWTSQSFLACSVCTYSIFLLFLLFSTSAYIIACSRYIRPSFDPYIFALNTLSPGGIPSGTIHLSLLINQSLCTYSRYVVSCCCLGSLLSFPMHLASPKSSMAQSPSSSAITDLTLLQW